MGFVSLLSMENLEPTKLSHGLVIAKRPIATEAFQNENLPEAQLARNLDIIESFIFKPLAEINSITFGVELSNVDLR
ncbi:hypothetical protein GCM10007906_14610 [Vibrio hyugaensis]|uniref:Uncharacterized protein n=1 Tax=Vibrio hyugaensis TaxID=1534743 RepID=A0ABQ5Y1L3_9VIBR|nr:hypothetical protein GCM10007906_14610 [Vibrio hyugaensis]